MHRRGGGKFRGGNRNFQGNDRFQVGKCGFRNVIDWIFWMVKFFCRSR